MKKLKKLQLAKETVRNLQREELHLLVGGVTGGYCVTPHVRCTV
jgi:natural product precursor